jgi:hypothetical protein
MLKSGFRTTVLGIVTSTVSGIGNTKFCLSVKNRMEVLLSQFPGVIFAGGGVVTSTTPGVQKTSPASSDRIDRKVTVATKKTILAIMRHDQTEEWDNAEHLPL